MKKTLAKGLALAFIGSLFVAGSAMALSITLYDNVSTTITVNDGGSKDTNDQIGAVTYNGDLGTDWLMNVTTGTSYPIIGSASVPWLDLNSVDATSSAGGHLTLSVTDTYNNVAGLEAWISGFMLSVGGISDGTVDFSADINGTNLNLPWGDMQHLGKAFMGVATLDGIPAGTDPFDMTITADIYHTGVGLSSFDVELSPVPEPATMLLFGTGLAGLATLHRRKANK